MVNIGMAASIPGWMALKYDVLDRNFLGRAHCRLKNYVELEKSMPPIKRSRE